MLSIYPAEHNTEQKGFVHVGIAVALLVVVGVTALTLNNSENKISQIIQKNVGDVLQSSSSSCTHYVAPNGNDNSSGTSASSPWKTIKYATSTNNLSPGDTVCLRAGTYSEGVLIINTGPSGSSGNYITFKNYPGETPILKNTALRFKGKDYIRVEGLRFENVPNSTLTHEAETKTTKGVQFVNNTFENTTDTPDMTYIRVTSWGGNDEPPVYLRVQDVLIEGNVTIDDKYGVSGDLNDNADCIQVGGNVDYLRILNNEVYECYSIGITIAGRSWKNDDSLPAHADDLNVDQADYVLVKGNLVDDVGNAIYLDAPGDYVIVEDNLAFDSKQGVIIAGEGVTSGLDYKHGILRRNIAYNNGFNSNFGGRSSAHSTEATSCDEVVANEDIVYVHNTFYSDNNSTTASSRHQCGINYRYKNNIVAHIGSATKKHYDISRDFVDTSTWQLDYNLFYSGSTPKTFKWTNTVYDNFTDYKAGTGKDQNSFEADPKFVNASARNFNLASGSPAIDAGGNLTTTDSAGNGKVISVKDARYFTDGYTLQAGDLIRIGDDTVRVTSVNYNNNDLTVDKSITWTNNEPVNYDYAGNKPDIGAIESGYTSTTPPPPDPDPDPVPDPDPTCGDNVCNGTETCSTCSSDCGVCTGSDKLYKAKKTETPISIDGEINEFENANELVLETPQSTGTYKLLWDENALYIGANVTDTTLNAVNTVTDTSVWQDDSLEFVVDTSKQALNSKDTAVYKFILNILNVVRDEHATDATWNSSLESKVKVSGTVGNNNNSDEGYTMELRIPWSDLNYVASDNKTISIDIGLNDETGSGRDQSIWSNSDGGSINQPVGWGDLLLSDETVNTPNLTGVYEAEDAEFGDSSGLGTTKIATNHAGFSGTGFVDTSDFPNGAGGYVKWTITASETGEYELGFNYGLAKLARDMNLIVNGKVVETLTFNTTGNWANWQILATNAPLVAGVNTIELLATTTYGGPNLDYLKVSQYSNPLPDPDPGPGPDPDPIPGDFCGDNICSQSETCNSCETDCGTCGSDLSDKYEAEDAEFGDKVRGGESKVATVHEGYSGTGYVNLSDYPLGKGGYITWSITVQNAGEYDMKIYYALNKGTRNMSLSINGTALEVIPFESTGSWTTRGYVSKTITLQEGTNVISIEATTNKGGPDIDYLTLAYVGPGTQSIVSPFGNTSPINPQGGTDTDNTQPDQTQESTTEELTGINETQLLAAGEVFTDSFESDPSTTFNTRGRQTTFEWANQAYKGSKSLSIIQLDDRYGGDWLSKPSYIPLPQGNTTYKLTVWVKAFNVTKNAKITMNFYGGLVSLRYINRYEVNIPSAQLKGDGWTPIELVGTAPTDATYAKIDLSLNGSGTVWFDNLILEKLTE
ncbi:MAG: sugar-binding protein [Patescibacteria group bacterium]